MECKPQSQEVVQSFKHGEQSERIRALKAAVQHANVQKVLQEAHDQPRPRSGFYFDPVVVLDFQSPASKSYEPSGAVQAALHTLIKAVPFNYNRLQPLLLHLRSTLSLQLEFRFF